MPSTITKLDNIYSGYVYLKDASVGGEVIEVWIDPDYAVFISYDKKGVELKRGSDMDEVIQRTGGVLRRRDRTVKVPFKDAKGVLAFATGKHSGTGNIMVKYPGERKRQLDEYELGRCYTPETTDEVFERITEVQRLISDLTAEKRHLDRDYKINLRSAVAEAVDAKVKTEDEAKWKASATAADETDTEDEF
jgi:hypothetical protein